MNDRFTRQELRGLMIEAKRRREAQRKCISCGNQTAGTRASAPMLCGPCLVKFRHEMTRRLRSADKTVSNQRAVLRELAKLGQEMER